MKCCHTTCLSDVKSIICVARLIFYALVLGTFRLYLMAQKFTETTLATTLTGDLISPALVLKNYVEDNLEKFFNVIHWHFVFIFTRISAPLGF